MEAWTEPLARFETFLCESGLLGGTVTGYLRDIRSFARWLEETAGQSVSPLTYTAADVAAYQRHLQHTLGRSSATVNRTLQSLRKFGRFAVRAGWRHEDPAREVSLLEPPDGDASILDRAEVQELLRCAQERDGRSAGRDVALLMLLLHTGIRVSELVHLSPGDVYTGNWEGDGAYLRVPGHGRHAERRLPLNEASRQALLAYLQQPRPADATRLFLSRGGNPLSQRTVQQIVAGLGEAAGLDISARTLRNTYARRVWEQTGDLTLLVERMGHRRLESALKYILPMRQTKSSTEVPEGANSGTGR